MRESGIDVYAMQDPRATTVAKSIFEKYLNNNDVLYLSWIPPDQGRQFENDLMQTLCENLGINKMRTMLYYPHADGLIDSFILSYKNNYIQRNIADNGSEWDSFSKSVCI